MEQNFSLIMMRILILFSVFTFSCKKQDPKEILKQDKVLSEMDKEISFLEDKRAGLQSNKENLEKKILSLSLNQKIVEIIKKQKMDVDQTYNYLNQSIDYLKIKRLEREKYLLDNQNKITPEMLEQQLKEHELNKAANPMQKPWENERLAPLFKQKDKPEEKKEAAGGGHH